MNGPTAKVCHLFHLNRISDIYLLNFRIPKCMSDLCKKSTNFLVCIFQSLIQLYIGNKP